MLLLVSVSDDGEARSALDGGADIIDAKNPLAGPLGAVSLEVLREIDAVVGSRRPLTAALGDARDAAAIAWAAREFGAAGAQLVKVGFAGIDSDEEVSRLLGSAVQGALCGGRTPLGTRHGLPAGVVAVAYADAGRAASVPPDAVVRAAAMAGARGVLLDTFDKEGPGLRQLLTTEALTAWVELAREAGLLVTVAGRLGADDITWVRAGGADVVGVRGAACEGGRTGRVTRARVGQLHALCGTSERSERPNDPNPPSPDGYGAASDPNDLLGRSRGSRAPTSATEEALAVRRGDRGLADVR